MGDNGHGQDRFAQSRVLHVLLLPIELSMSSLPYRRPQLLRPGTPARICLITVHETLPLCPCFSRLPNHRLLFCILPCSCQSSCVPAPQHLVDIFLYARLTHVATYKTHDACLSFRPCSCPSCCVPARARASSPWKPGTGQCSWRGRGGPGWQ
jgi:hypothetical protein